MFRHKGKHRSFKQNLKLAGLLSFVAGIVNVSGFLAIKILTTHVTGHFAFFADELVQNRFHTAMIYFLYIFSFFAGAFFSGLSVEYIAKRRERYMYFIPLILEMIILSVTAAFNNTTLDSYAPVIASAILFAMGMQNALVTSISNAVVRTTHLTGLVTDLGIEIAQLFFYTQPEQLKRLKTSIQLRLAIIGFFLAGCIAGGIGYNAWGIHIMFLAVLSLAGGLIFESIRPQIAYIKRKYTK
ncbi:MAG: DUF1275 domain-containing protein [Chitinophagales bacterium]|nr:DUF1275 domain-containing protein [Chitinophagales bacterium]